MLFMMLLENLCKLFGQMIKSSISRKSPSKARNVNKLLRKSTPFNLDSSKYKAVQTTSGMMENAKAQLNKNLDKIL